MDNTGQKTRIRFELNKQLLVTKKNTVIKISDIVTKVEELYPNNPTQQGSIYAWLRGDRYPKADNLAQIIHALSELTQKAINIGDILKYENQEPSLFIQADRFFQDNDSQKALSLYKLYLDSEDSLSTDERIQTKLKIAEIKFNFGEIGESEEGAITYYKQALELVLGGSEIDPLANIKTHIGLGNCYTITGETQKAYDYFTEAINEISDIEQDKQIDTDFANLNDDDKTLLVLEAKAFRGQGDVRRREGYITGAIVKYNIAIAKLYNLDTNESQLEFAHALNSLGAAYDDKDDFNKASSYHNEAKSIRENLNNKRDEAYCHYDLGNSYIKRAKSLGSEERKEMLDRARKSYSQALNLARNSGDKRVTAYGERGLGHYYRGLSQNKEALKHYQSSLDTFNIIGDIRGVSYTTLAKVKTQRKIDANKKSTRKAERIKLSILLEEEVKQALENFKTCNDVRGQKRSFLLLGRILYRRYELLRDTKSKREDQFKTLEDSFIFYKKAEGIQSPKDFKEWSKIYNSDDPDIQKSRAHLGIVDISQGITFLGLGTIHKEYVKQKYIAEESEKDHTDESEWYFLIALGSFRDTHVLHLAYTNMHRGELREILGNTKSAHTHYRAALHGFKSINYETGIEEVTKKFKTPILV